MFLTNCNFYLKPSPALVVQIAIHSSNSAIQFIYQSYNFTLVRVVVDSPQKTADRVPNGDRRERRIYPFGGRRFWVWLPRLGTGE